MIISYNSVEMDPVKVAGVAEWPVPNNKKEVQSFLGFINFYRRFIQDFSHHARPLFNITKNDVKWLWSQEEQSAFDTLKGLVTSAPILTSPDNSRPFRIEADSSDFATGAVLSQESATDGDAHGILLYTENDYFYFSMHSSSLYSIFANWLCERPRLHEYYTSSVRCHTTSRLEPVSLSLKGFSEA